MAEFNLWDTEAGSFIGKYPDERSALETVRKLVDHFGLAYADDLSLGRIADDGRALAPLTGRVLVARLEKTDEPRQPNGCASSATNRLGGMGTDAAAGASSDVALVSGRVTERRRAVVTKSPAAPRSDRRKTSGRS